MKSLQFARHATKALRCNGFVADEKILYRFKKKRYNIDRYFGKNGEKSVGKNIMHQTKGMKGENQYGDAKSDKRICGTI